MFPTPRSAAGSTFHSVGPTAVPCVAELSVPLGNDGCGIFSPPKLLRSNIIEIYIPAWSYYLRVSSVGVEAASVTTTSCCNASNQLPRLQYTFSCRPCLLSLSPFFFFSSPFSPPPRILHSCRSKQHPFISATSRCNAVQSTAKLSSTVICYNR